MLKKRSHFLKTTSQSVLFFIGAATLFAGETPFTETDTIIDAGDMRFSAEDGVQYLSGGVRVSAGELQLRTEEMIYNAETQIAEIPTPSTLDFQGSRFIFGSAEFDGNAQKLVSKKVRGGRDFAFFGGDSISASRDFAEIRGAAFYLGEPHWSTISFTTEKLAYDAEEDYFHLGSSVFRVAGVPVLPLPELSVIRFDRPPVRVWFNPGESGSAGTYFRSETYLTLWDEFEPGVLLDFYERSGILAGPAATYDTYDSAFPLKMRGHFRSGYINDTANREDDIYGNAIGGRRGFIDWFHKQHLERIEVSASIHKWSDSEVMRDFRPKIYDENQNPDSYIEFVLPDDYFYASAFTRLHLNDYQNVQQRLPELRFDLQPTPLGKTGIYQHFSASYAFLREESSDQYDFFRYGVIGNDGPDALESSRANVYIGWTAPIKFGNFGSFTPVLGVMTTCYGETIGANPEETYTRTLGQVGFDMEFVISGTNNYRNETWGINGLRHILRPVLQYRYIPNPTVGDHRIPAIDREIYLSRPTIIDLSDNRAIDQLYDEHVFRIGLENLFQTRADGYGSRDLVELNIYQDFRKTYRPGDTRTLSDNFIDLNVTPADWVSFNVSHRMDVYDFSTNALTTGMTLTDGDVWKASFGTIHLYKNPYPSAYGESRARQLYAGIDYRLNTFWAAFAHWRFDDLRNEMTDQVYGVRQRLGNIWEIEYSVRHRRNAGDDSDFSFNVGASLMLF
ncbi:MAG: LPS assembly protein LptD [Opitutales bacterium]|nr:LPS assembly protein LptD [Opitutales bacterium]